MSTEDEDTPVTHDREERSKKEIGTKTWFELSRSMMDKAVGVVKEQSDESDKRVADAYETGMNAVVELAKANQQAEDRRSARNFRIMMAFVAILGAVSIGAGAVKFFGIEIGDVSEDASVEEYFMEDEAAPEEPAP